MPLPKELPRALSAKAKRVLANRYEVDKKLGSGNFGTAWLVTDRKTKDEKDNSKVLKEISVGDLQPDETVDAMSEAKLLRQLDHPGIVRFHDSFIDGEYFCIVTEFCEGGDLDVRINQYKKQGKKFQEPLVVEWLIQLSLAVQYMHSRRVLHRDLKTRNIFLKNNMIKIGDFGISRILMGTTDMASTFTGTPYYMSPEVLKHEGYNSKSDVWSIGCILYEMVELKHAFEGQSLMGVMYSIVEGQLPEWPKEYSKDLEKVFHFIMNKDPKARPSASELLKHPFIANHMELMKNTLVIKHKTRQSDDSIIETEANQIAKVMREKSYLEDLRQSSAEEAKLRKMTPRERMILRKKQKADEEAARLKRAAQVELADNKKAYAETRKHLDAYKSEVPPWMKEDRGKDKQNKGDMALTGRPFTAPIHIQHVSDDEDSDDADIVYSHSKTLQPPGRKNFGNATYTADDRPITPMKNKMVYSLTDSSLDFKDGIPDQDELANTYYSQFDDEFDYVDGDDDYDGTLVNTVQAAGMGEEVEDLITCMQNALDRSDTIKSQTITDDTVAGAYGPTARGIKIKNLRAECEQKLGKEEFQKAYELMKAARFGDRTLSSTEKEMDINRELRKIVKNPNDCFLVDQLLFLEEQSKI